jgi:hypothetical protein
MRAGIEDYELIMLLAEKSPEKAKELVEKCVKSFTDYTNDVEEFMNVYQELLDQL